MQNFTDLSGKTLGQYQIIQELGRGRRAIVYEARQSSLDRIVALKVLSPRLSQDKEFAERFVREARATSNLHHPHIVTIYDVGEAKGLLYIAVERLSGQTLADELEPENPMPINRALLILEQVADALDYAHQCEMLSGTKMMHGNVKPANIALETRPDGTLRTILTDFGLVKAWKSVDSITDTITIFGTPKYMSPELIECQEITPAADLYALGAVAFEMLTGRVPFIEKSIIGTLLAHVNQPPPDAGQFNPKLPKGVSEIFFRVLAKAPTERFMTAMEFVGALKHAAQKPPMPQPEADAEEHARLLEQLREYQHKLQSLEEQLAGFSEGAQLSELNPAEREKIASTQAKLGRVGDTAAKRAPRPAQQESDQVTSDFDNISAGESPPALPTDDITETKLPFRQVKAKVLEKRLEVLMSDYQAANEQLNAVLDSVARNQLKRQIENLEGEIVQVEQELEALRKGSKE